MTLGLLRSKFKLALNHREHVDGDARVELQATCGACEHVAFEPLAN
jgi:hypothetical protein